MAHPRRGRRADQAAYDIAVAAVAASDANDDGEPIPLPPRLLLLQAETAADGSVVYGYLSRHSRGQIPASELMDVKSVAQLASEREAARAARIEARKAAVNAE